MIPTPIQVKKFQNLIFTWWKDNARDLPWRKTRDPYKILISEVMLQQTQVSRVLPKYTEFIEAFPTVEALAASSPAAVLRLWKGMGYNRRALHLKHAAEAIVRDHKDKFPNDESLLVKLPGVGTYTARALLVFAFEKNVAMVDTNIRQIITHFFYNDTIQRETVIQKTADILVPRGKSWMWHQALMDYGALALPKTKNIKKKTIPFWESNRYVRGKIIDRLRTGAIREDILLKEFSNKDLIDGLIKDGLVERSGRMLHLPE